MASNDTKLGGGYASGMLYHAPSGTALPTYPSATLDPAWVEIGDISEEGITWATARSFEALKNWALETKRMKPGTDSQTISAPIMDTTEEVFKTIFGSSNVTKTAADNSHGVLLTVDTSALNTPSAEAYLFIMKDGDDMIALGTTSGYISELGEVAFKATDAINWTATFSAKAFTLITDDGQTV